MFRNILYVESFFRLYHVNFLMEERQLYLMSFFIGMAGVPSRFREGMLVLSGDVLLLFNPLQIDAQFHGAAAISMKSPVDVGKDHGVFLE